MLRHAALVAALLTSPAVVWAQVTPTVPAGAAAANQLGVLEYCAFKGFSGADAVAAQRAAVARLPDGGTAREAEELGRAGTMLAGSERLSLTEIAAQHYIDVPALCRQMADAVVRADAMLKQNGTSAGGIPGLPALSDTPTVPGIAPLPGAQPMPGVTSAK